MQDPRYKHEYLDSDQSWLTITEETMMKVTNI